MSTSGAAQFIDADGFELDRIDESTFNGYWSSTKVFYLKVPAGSRGPRIAYFNAEFSGNYADPSKLSEVYISIDPMPAPISGEIASSTGDLNPAHIIRECLTNPVWGIGVLEADIDDISFKKAADVLFDEGMGMSIKWDDSTSIEEFIDIIKKHINAELYFDKSDAKWKLYLIRADYNANDLEHLNESHVQNLEFERRTLAECINSVTLTYWDRERSKDSTVTVQDIARIAQQGGVVSQSVDYKGFTNNGLASRVAYRELQTLSANLASVSFDVTENQVQNWHLGKPFKLSDDNYGLSSAIFRVKEMRFGDGINNTVSIDAVEDSFSSPLQSIVEYMPPIKTSFDAIDATAIAFEVPYIELVEQYGQDEIDVKLDKNSDLSYVGMAAIRPSNSHINAALFSDAGAGYDEVSTLDFCPVATLKVAISYTDSILQLQSIREFNLVKVSNRVQIGSELMSVVSFDAEAKTLTVKRGVFDTVPAQHFVGAMLYAWDNYSGLDKTEYLSGEVVSLKALTQTSADQLSIDVATAHTVTCNARAIRPYPPANVLFNQENYPQRVIGDLQVMWSARNRIQQTGGDPIGWFEDSTSMETGMSFNVELWQGTILKYSQDYYSGTLLNFSKDDLAGQRHTLKIQSWRDGYKSMQVFEHEFLHRMTAERISKPYDLIAIGGDSSIQLTWKADGYTSNIDYYNIYRHIQFFDGSDVTYLLLQTNVIEKSFTDETAVAGTRYFYRVEAVVEQTAEEAGLMLMSDEIVDAVRNIDLSASVLKSKVLGHTAGSASISVEVDTSLEANMKADGSEISGKAEAGSIITIEIED
ncbi:hypothetical protein D7V64_08190 [Acinetobacter cumulans]|uniref:Tip attachment protein J domain-containing protein n=2 Tax=Acinetobacter cumulans TaxID=2136182 RepID=A0A3A8G1U3_9GAMM|nr:hypothetical protein D7V64_08190 [Acinetobacter cumulans]